MSAYVLIVRVYQILDDRITVLCESCYKHDPDYAAAKYSLCVDHEKADGSIDLLCERCGAPLYKPVDKDCTQELADWVSTLWLAGRGASTHHVSTTASKDTTKETKRSKRKRVI